jgi:hypothetical protein
MGEEKGREEGEDGVGRRRMGSGEWKRWSGKGGGGMLADMSDSGRVE